MNPSFDTGMLSQLHERKSAFPIDEDILARIGPSTLGAETLQFLGMLVLWKQPQHIFEFGSGLSTLFLARLLQRLGTTSPFPMMSIDHSHRYLGETRRALGGSTEVHLVHAPLAVTECAGRVFTTYHPAYLREIPRDVRFDFVLIDGPPAYRYGREAPLYHLAPYLTQDALIVLDDANREPEQEAIANWQRTWPDGFAMMHFPELKKGLAVLRIGEPARAIATPAVGEQVTADLNRVITFLKAEGGVVADGR